ASVNYVIAKWPCYSRADKPLPFKNIPVLANQPQQLTDAVALLSGQYVLSTEGEVFCKFDWRVDPVLGAHMAGELDIVDENGKLLTQGSRVELCRIEESLSTTFLSIQIPNFHKRKGDVFLILRLYVPSSEGMVRLVRTTLPVREYGLELLKVSPQQTD